MTLLLKTSLEGTQDTFQGIPMSIGTSLILLAWDQLQAGCWWLPEGLSIRELCQQRQLCRMLDDNI